MIGASRPARSVLRRGGGEFSVPLFISMGRILAIDYGQKRCGVATTDPLQITPGGLGTIPTHQLLSFVTDYVSREPVELIIIGYPRQMNSQESASMKYIRPFVEKLRKALPEIPLEYQPLRHTPTASTAPAQDRLSGRALHLGPSSADDPRGGYREEAPRAGQGAGR